MEAKPLNELNRVLVINDSLDGLDIALKKAALLEHYTGCDIEVAEVLWDSVADEPLSDTVKEALIQGLIRAEQQDLNAIVAPYENRVATAEARILWDKSSNEAIAREIAEQSVDLVIKPMGAHGLKDFLSTPLDWQLIRDADCPVLISKNSSWETGGCVLAAVDVQASHRVLNHAVLNAAEFIARTLDAELHVVTVCPEVSATISERHIELDPGNLQDELLETRHQRLGDMVSDLTYEKIETHVLAGKPAEVIPTLAASLDVTITTVGTHSRSGIDKLLLGNTAEKVLAKIPGDVLTIRPHYQRESA